MMSEQEGWYCEGCDRSYADDDFSIEPVDQWHERYACPHCWRVFPRTYLSDRFYELGFYLLSIADEDGLLIIPDPLCPVFEV